MSLKVRGFATSAVIATMLVTFVPSAARAAGMMIDGQMTPQPFMVFGGPGQGNLFHQWLLEGTGQPQFVLPDDYALKPFYGDSITEVPRYGGYTDVGTGSSGTSTNCYVGPSLAVGSNFIGIHNQYSGALKFTLVVKKGDGTTLSSQVVSMSANEFRTFEVDAGTNAAASIALATSTTTQTLGPGNVYVLNSTGIIGYGFSLTADAHLNSGASVSKPTASPTSGQIDWKNGSIMSFAFKPQLGNLGHASE